MFKVLKLSGVFFVCLGGAGEIAGFWFARGGGGGVSTQADTTHRLILYTTLKL